MQLTPVRGPLRSNLNTRLTLGRDLCSPAERYFELPMYRLGRLPSRFYNLQRYYSVKHSRQLFSSFYLTYYFVRSVNDPWIPLRKCASTHNFDSIFN